MRKRDDSMSMDLINVLSEIALLNKDDGERFTVTDRIDRISMLLKESNYKLAESGDLFRLYSKKPIEDMKMKPVIVVSTHIDCQSKITKCFSESVDTGMLRGTYDNLATNAAILSLMHSDSLPENVVVAFTGDEERKSRGAKALVKFLKKNDIAVRHIFVLDVTDCGWNEECDFTIENNFWHDDYGKSIVSFAANSDFKWRFVPSDPNDVPSFVPKQNTIYVEAEPDESWEYDEKNMNCCSICVPVKGEMHSNEGVLMREEGYRNYTEGLRRLLEIS